MNTRFGVDISDKMFRQRIDGLVNQFYKILPIKESGEPSLQKYIESLQREMIGMKALITALDYDQQYLSLLAILQYLIDHDCDVDVVRSDVFKSISILKRLQRRFDIHLEGG